MEDLVEEELMERGNFWFARPTLVTGAGGLLGSCLVKVLVRLNAEVVCVVRDWLPQSELFRSGTAGKVKIARGDVRDQEFLERVLGEYEIRSVFHLAAQTIVPIGNRNPVSTLESNIKGTWCLLEACRRSPLVSEIVAASSDKAYGVHANLPYKEDAPLKGTHPYDVSKSCADLLCCMYAESFNLPVVVTRCGNLYGGGDLNFNRLIPGTIRSVIRGERPIIRSDGTFLRDYFYVEDAALAYMRLLQKFAEHPELKGEAYNLSNEQPLRVLEVVKKILLLMDSKLEPVLLNEASGEIKEQYLNAEKARKVLGWTPKYDIESGLKKTISWYRDFFRTETA